MKKYLVTFVERREILIGDNSALCHEGCPSFIPCDLGKVECVYFDKKLEVRNANEVERCGECILAVGAEAWDCRNNHSGG